MIGNVNNTAMHFASMFLFDMIASADLNKSLEMKLGEFCCAFANGTAGDPPLGDLEKHKDPMHMRRLLERYHPRDFVLVGQTPLLVSFPFIDQELIMIHAFDKMPLADQQNVLHAIETRGLVAGGGVARRQHC